jgi:hypothetical protein
MVLTYNNTLNNLKEYDYILVILFYLLYYYGQLSIEGITIQHVVFLYQTYYIYKNKDEDLKSYTNIWIVLFLHYY